MILIFLPLLIAVFVLQSQLKETRSKPYTVFNKRADGISVFYETMKALNDSVHIARESIERYPADTIQIIVEPTEDFNLEDQRIKKWAANGGFYIFLTSDWERDKENFLKEKNQKLISDISNEQEGVLFTYGKGKILIGNSKMIENRTLHTNTEKAYWIFEQIQKHPSQAVYFNEFYHGYGVIQNSLWKDMPIGVKVVVFQFLLVIFSWLYYKGRRFGKVEFYYEEVEREENEYMDAVAALYHQVGNWEGVFFHFYTSFLNRFRKLLALHLVDENWDWVEAWKSEQLPQTASAKKLLNFVQCKVDLPKSSKRKIKMYSEMIGIIEQLCEILEKRRIQKWKKLN